ncbi:MULTISPECIES: LysR family transcriptional regulator [Micromonospora]|uniref:LysR family transcriptional regulator n=2 Tax=Micromonosporaceae TaxID=28056 RepID=UPI0003EEC349|nr:MULTISPECIES: LysR family transcriptional regulator [Micromonospora]EWM64977.1 small neutral protease regulatory protein [Micromonospora sp. M42]MBP1781979.1 DNA-binding transcriptional LysR family regulator [Micromonospora sp. HB375]MCK1804770.1 LysR family transcriptional regulator [Micromonospora sp. R42106]MCK1832357.1 LysR family transcriptional regulator [Micromonospora sp. R42003]MCK1843708.1 LysR family transcriptional regulator [Micromonospora sp. R42004]
MGIDVRHLRAISAIAEAGSVTGAAARLGLSQPALTAQVHRIEKTVGGPLFVRSRTGMQPTELGKQVLQRARVVLAEVDALVEDFGDRHPIPGLLRLGTVHIACAGSLVRHVAEAFPDPEIALQIEPSSRLLVEALTRGQLDAALLGILEGFELPIGPTLTSRPLIPRYPIFVAMSASHPQSHHEQVRLADLRNESWVCPPGPDDGSLASLRRACRAAGFEPKIRYEAPSGAAHPLVAAGDGVRLVDPTWAPAAGTRVLPLRGEPQLLARLVVVWRRDALTHAESSALFQAITRAYLDHVNDNAAFARWWRANPHAHPAAS